MYKSLSKQDIQKSFRNNFTGTTIWCYEDTIASPRVLVFASMPLPPC